MRSAWISTVSITVTVESPLSVKARWAYSLDLNLLSRSLQIRHINLWVLCHIEVLLRKANSL